MLYLSVSFSRAYLQWRSSSGNLMHMLIYIYDSFHDTTLAALKSSQNERLWFKTNMKLAKLWFDKHEFHRLQVCSRHLSLFFF